MNKSLKMNSKALLSLVVCSSQTLCSPNRDLVILKLLNELWNNKRLHVAIEATHLCRLNRYLLPFLGNEVCDEQTTRLPGVLYYSFLRIYSFISRTYIAPL